MELSETYATRSFRFLRLIEPNGWRIKLYGIRYGAPEVDPALVESALPELLARLESPEAGQNHYGVGFAAVHQGKTGNFVFIDWWADENELHHHVFVSSMERPDSFTYVTPSGLAACAWDLHLLCFERQAWVETVLANPEGPDLDAYVARRFNGTA